MSNDATSTGTVDRVALMLRVLAEADGELSVAQVTERMKLPTSTTHRLLGLLVSTGLAERSNRPGMYRVGLEFLRLGGLVVSRTEITSLAEEFMRRVTDATEETSVLNLYVPSEQKGMIVKVIYGRHPLRIEQELYKASPLMFGALCRGILSFLPDDVIDAVLAKREPSPVTGRPLTDLKSAKREFAAIREQGYALSKGQRTQGAVGMAAPVFKGHGKVIASLCVTMPATRFSEQREGKIAQVLLGESRKLSAALGSS